MQANVVIELSLQQATEVTGGTLTQKDCESTVFQGVSIDTRTLQDGELYVAIRGESHDGHQFLPEAQAHGAVGAILERHGVELLPDALPGVVVPDSHQALIDLAIAHRKSMTTETAGITGSVGKTTVKELTRHLLEHSGATAHASAGNLNNLYGLPLSILQMDESAQYGVFELGISTPGEMSRLAPILQPRVGVITNISATHVEALGSISGVLSEKVRLFENLADGGTAVVDGGDSELLNATRALCDKVLTFAVATKKSLHSCKADIVASGVTVDSTTGYVSFECEGQWVRLPMFGAEQVSNALCAVATCRALGAKVDMRSLETFSSDVMALRGSRRKIAGVDVIVDCYNANPTSMRAGLKTFVSLKPGEQGARKIVALGDMLELGSIESEEHLALGRYLMSLLGDGGTTDVVITVGERARLIAVGLKDKKHLAVTPVIHSVSDADEAGELLADIARPGDVVFLKASRGIALESALDVMKAGKQK